jgi:dTDP-D-glucose 4,6-dehydratase
MYGSVQRDWGHVKDFMDAVYLIIQEQLDTKVLGIKSQIKELKIQIKVKEQVIINLQL